MNHQHSQSRTQWDRSFRKVVIRDHNTQRTWYQQTPASSDQVFRVLFFAKHTITHQQYQSIYIHREIKIQYYCPSARSHRLNEPPPQGLTTRIVLILPRMFPTVLRIAHNVFGERPLNGLPRIIHGGGGGSTTTAGGRA